MGRPKKADNEQLYKHGGGRSRKYKLDRVHFEVCRMRIGKPYIRINVFSKSRGKNAIAIIKYVNGSRKQLECLELPRHHVTEEVVNKGVLLIRREPLYLIQNNT